MIETGVRSTSRRCGTSGGFKHPIKLDKKGQNPASLLIKVLYKHLLKLLDENAVQLIDRLHGEMRLDQIMDEISADQNRHASFGVGEGHDQGASVKISCQLIKKALKGLRLVPKKKMADGEKQIIKLM